MTIPVLEIRDITKRFPGVLALDSVGLRIMQGEILAVVGENGAGKSTLMKILGGVHQPDLGQILMDGRPAIFHSTKESISAGIALIHQELSVLDNLDVAGNIFLGREPLKGGPLRLVDQRRIHSQSQVYLDMLGLNVSTRAPVSRLSIAQRQLVEIAKALSQSARVLIMDEPTSSLTLTETSRLLELAKDLRSRSVSIIYVSHRLSEIKEIADRVEVLRDGKNAGTLSREEISHKAMIKLMVGRDIAPPPAEMGIDQSANATIFEVRDLRTRRYPARQVSFALRKGEILCLAGLVGAGRSELAQAIFGVDAPLAGSVLLNGARIKITSSKDAISNGIYLIPEDRRQCGLLTAMTIRENIALPALENFATAGLVSYRKERKSVEEIFAHLRIKAPSIESKASNLSGGNQQKVVLAKWIGLDPKVLIFDEPTRGIDVGAKAEIYKSMRDLASEGIGILVISSDMEEVLMISDRVAVMHEGSVTGILDRHDCSEEAIMRLAIGHEVNTGQGG